MIFLIRDWPHLFVINEKHSFANVRTSQIFWICRIINIFFQNQRRHTHTLTQNDWDLCLCHFNLNRKWLYAVVHNTEYKWRQISKLFPALFFFSFSFLHLFLPLSLLFICISLSFFVFQSMIAIIMRML